MEPQITQNTRKAPARSYDSPSQQVESILAGVCCPYHSMGTLAPHPPGRPSFLAAPAHRPHIPAMPSLLTLTLNGESRALDGPVTVAGLLASLGLEARKVAVERNEAIVPRSSYTETWLASGDQLEIVHFIGGG